MRVSTWQSWGGAGSPQPGREAAPPLGEGRGGTGTHGRGGLTRSSWSWVVGAPREWGLWGPLEGSVTLLWGWVQPHLSLLCLVWRPDLRGSAWTPRKGPPLSSARWVFSGCALMVLSHLFSS